MNKLLFSSDLSADRTHHTFGQRPHRATAHDGDRQCDCAFRSRCLATREDLKEKKKKLLCEASGEGRCRCLGEPPRADSGLPMLRRVWSFSKAFWMPRLASMPPPWVSPPPVGAASCDVASIDCNESAQQRSCDRRERNRMAGHPHASDKQSLSQADGQTEMLMPASSDRCRITWLLLRLGPM